MTSFMEAINDALYGGNNNDLLKGEDGADRLEGGAGRDRLYAGNDDETDTFIFNATSDSSTGTRRDKLYEFESGEDLIDLALLDADTNSEGNQTFSFSGNTATTNSVWSEQSGSDLIIKADVNGDTTSDFELLIVDIGDVYVDDFIL